MNFAHLLRARMLAAKFSFAVAPTAAGDHRGDARVGAAGEDRHRRAEAAADERDTLRVDFRPRRQVGDGVARVGDLIEADDPAAFAFAVAAAAEIDAQRDIAPFGHLFADDLLALAVLVAAKAMQHDKRRPALAGFVVFRNIDEAGKFEAVGLKSDFFFHLDLPPKCLTKILLTTKSTKHTKKYFRFVPFVCRGCIFSLWRG